MVNRVRAAPRKSCLGEALRQNGLARMFASSKTKDLRASKPQTSFSKADAVVHWYNHHYPSPITKILP